MNQWINPCSISWLSSSWHCFASADLLMPILWYYKTPLKKCFKLNELEYIHKARGLVHYSLHKCWSKSAKLFSGFLASHLQVWSTHSLSPTRLAHHHTRCRKHNTYFSNDSLLCTKCVISCNIKNKVFMESFYLSHTSFHFNKKSFLSTMPNINIITVMQCIMVFRSTTVYIYNGRPIRL